MRWDWKTAFKDLIKTGLVFAGFLFVFEYKDTLNEMYLAQLPVGYIVLFAIGYILLARLYRHITFVIRRFEYKDNRYNSFVMSCFYLIMVSIVTSSVAACDLDGFFTNTPEPESSVVEPTEPLGSVEQPDLGVTEDEPAVIEKENSIDQVIRDIKESEWYNTEEVEVMKGYNTYLVGADGHRITLVNYKNATDPTYNQLINFILMDDTDKHTYNYDSFVCADFAETVHNNAEKNGIKAGYVDMEFSDLSGGHCCNVFNTIDKGLVFIDCTSNPDSHGESWDSVVYLKEGEMYTPTALDRHDGSYMLPMGCVSDYQITW